MIIYHYVCNDCGSGFYGEIRYDVDDLVPCAYCGGALIEKVTDTTDEVEEFPDEQHWGDWFDGVWEKDEK